MSTLTSNLLNHAGTPTGREEAWRFTPLKRLVGLHDRETNVLDQISLFRKSQVENGFSLRVVSTESVPAVSKTDDVIVERIREVVAKVTLLEIEPNAEVLEPMTVIRAGANSKATVIIENTGESLIGEEIEIILDAGATLNFVTLQEWENSTVHLARHHAILGRDATFNSITVSVGGSVVRILPTVEYTGPGAGAELLGVYFATDGQHLEHRIHVDHGVPNAKSRVNYKGALAGNQARSVWIGDVFIRAIAEGTDTYELNRNLLLTDGARADSVPNLEIETGEIIGAGHASTTGRFDDEQLFYLMSRGIPSDEARRLVIRGFFTEIISKIGNEVIEERLMARIDRDLSRVGA